MKLEPTKGMTREDRRQLWFTLNESQLTEQTKEDVKRMFLSYGSLMNQVQHYERTVMQLQRVIHGLKTGEVLDIKKSLRGLKTGEVLDTIERGWDRL